MSRPKLTIGMAHHNDFDGAYFTIRHIQQTNKRLSEIEFVVVNNSIGTTHASYLKNFVENHCKDGTAGAQFVDYDVYGTTQPRNKVFEVAAGEVVLCVDCHIQLEPFAADRLIQFLEENPQTEDLFQGPMLGDHDEVYATHFDDVWRDQMWGIWATDPRGQLSPSLEALPVIERVQHTQQMPPFPIPAMGLGLFGCRKEAWLGFNPNFRGFGGEEWYIHEKYRKAGKECWCLPWLRWGHRFGRVSGIGYTLTADHKIVNYMYGHKELALPLDRVHEHFVGGGIIPQHRWDDLLKLVEQGGIMPPAAPPATMRRQGQAVAEPNPQAAQGIDHPLRGATIDQIFDAVKASPRDLDQHMDTLRHWAAKVEHVTEFSERKESTIAFISGRPVGGDKRKGFIFHSYNTEQDPLILPDGPLHIAISQEVNKRAKTTLMQTFADSMSVPPIEETDVLFIDTKHNGSRLSAELLKHGSQVRRAIIVHDTAGWLPMTQSAGNGEKGDDGGPGLNEALRNWVAQHPEWFVAFFDPNQYGLTIISRHPDDKPKEVVNAWLPGYGPGTEFQKILKSVDINPSAGCDCNAKAAQMDIWAVAGCNEHFGEIVQWLRDGETRWGWKDKWEGAAKLLLKDPMLAISLNPVDPFPGLVKASIKRARKYELKLLKERR